MARLCRLAVRLRRPVCDGNERGEIAAMWLIAPVVAGLLLGAVVFALCVVCGALERDE